MSSHPPGPRHVAALDGVRALAAVAVLLTHVGFLTGEVSPSMTGALVARMDVGVALFFALSGFLMLRPWIATAIGDRDRVPGLGSYAVKRATRILPAYWIAAAVVLLLEAGRVYRSTLSSPLRVDLPSVLEHVFVLQGYTGSYFSTFSQTWSLTTELTFYAAVPVLGVALVRACRRSEDRQDRLRTVRRACLAFVVLGVAVTAFTATDLPGSSEALARSVLGHAGWFAAGAWVCARTMDPPVSGRSSEERLGLAAVLLVVAATPLAGELLFSHGSAVQAGLRELLYTLIAGLVVSAACRPATSSPALQVLSSPAVVWVGERSYALFLWHLPIAFVLLTLLGHDLFEGSFVVITVLTLACSLVVADLSWRLVERPLMAANVRRDQRRREQRDEQQSARLGDDGHQ
ncbi:acyltransferase family protein [Aeromicrobium wangtongii]|uniref:Acyltransferase n=1 Tax=Aeromicrobium wangtongii TaxID=2969247 RepID=A0ABY5MBA8_9ACTN|nr:acyltransferase [Aeromicrobium wangtongii]MCD9197623.1 acyltransferase [Aeromicrobium wangtongii]UUP15112.1 acyltransferase [Aeromicrobium wangtongii]